MTKIIPVLLLQNFCSNHHSNRQVQQQGPAVQQQRQPGGNRTGTASGRRLHSNPPDQGPWR